MQSGHRTLQSSGNAQTDDRGVYRLFGLQPGEYLVSATPRNNSREFVAVQQREAAQSALERARTVAAANPEQAQVLAERIERLSIEVPAGEDGPAVGLRAGLLSRHDQSGERGDGHGRVRRKRSRASTSSPSSSRSHASKAS